MQNIRVYFDFVCPYCYTAWGHFRQLRRDGVDVNIEWYGWEIHPDWRGRDAKRAFFIPEQEAEFAALGKPSGVNAAGLRYTASSYDALRLLCAAEEQDLAREWVDRVFKGIRQEQQAMNDHDVLRAWADVIGLVGADDVLTTPKYADVIAAHDAHCMDIALEYVPTVEKDGRILLSGVLTYQDIYRALT